MANNRIYAKFTMKILIAKIILSIASTAALAVIAYSAWDELRNFWRTFTIKEAWMEISGIVIIAAIVWSLYTLTR